MSAFWFALSLTFIAGLATTIGAVLSTHKRMLNRGVFAVALGFSAGAMLYVSFTDILSKSLDSFGELLDAKAAYAAMVAAFFGGLMLMVALNRLIPSDINPNDQEGAKNSQVVTRRRLLRSGVFIGAALALHNFPEGFLVFMSALDDPSVGISIAVALAIHNIPEGLAVGAPIYAATKSRFKAIGISSLTGVAEPVGALIGYLLLFNYLNDAVFGVVFGVVAGMMVFICIDELIPAAKRYETKQRQTTYGFISGMAVIALSITMLQ